MCGLCIRSCTCSVLTICVCFACLVIFAFAGGLL